MNSTKIRRLGLRAKDITHTPCCAGKGVIYRQGSHAGRVLNKSKEIYVVSWPTFADGHNESQAEPAHLIFIFSFNFIYLFSVLALLICWSPDVRSFVLHFDDTIPSTEQYNLAAFDRYSCLKENDTVVVRHRQIRNQKSSKLLLKLSLDSRIPYTFRYVLRRTQMVKKNG